MGQNGVDVMLSPAAKRLFGRLAIECKNTESLNVVGTFWENAKKYPKDLPLLFHKKNNTTPLVTVPMSYFMSLLLDSVDMRQLKGGVSEP